MKKRVLALIFCLVLVFSLGTASVSAHTGQFKCGVVEEEPAEQEQNVDCPSYDFGGYDWNYGGGWHFGPCKPYIPCWPWWPPVCPTEEDPTDPTDPSEEDPTDPADPTDPTDPTDPSEDEPDDPTPPDTGDTANVVLWASAMTISMAGIAILCAKKRRA